MTGNLLPACAPLSRPAALRGKDHQAQALAQPGVRPMVMRGRTLEGYLYIDRPR
jgi:hypothetical protein